MDVLSVLRLLWRQKIVVVLTSMMVVAGLVMVVVAAPPVYRASSSVVLLNPPTPIASEVEGASDDTLRSLDNPYERFNDLSVVVDIIRRILSSVPTSDALAERGLIGTYTVAANIDFYRGPIVDVAAEAGTEADALTATQLVVEMLDETLAEVQERQGTDPDYFITSDVVVPATRATRVLSSTLRRLIAVGAVGVMFVFGSAIAADAISSRRRSSRTKLEAVVHVNPTHSPSEVRRSKQSTDSSPLAHGERK